MRQYSSWTLNRGATTFGKKSKKKKKEKRNKSKIFMGINAYGYGYGYGNGNLSASKSEFNKLFFIIFSAQTHETRRR